MTKNEEIDRETRSYWTFDSGIVQGLRNYFQISIPWQQQERLTTTCFRGKSHPPLAGNFLWWESAAEVMSEIGSMVATKCDQEITRNNQRRAQGFEVRLTVCCGRVIGWQSTTSRVQDAMMQPGDTEMFNLNRHTTALRVKSDSNLEAPLTDLVTMVIQFHWQSNLGQWTGFIQTIYPGRDIGRLRPNTDKGNFLRGVTFFGWNHPGNTDADEIQSGAHEEEKDHAKKVIFVTYWDWREQNNGMWDALKGVVAAIPSFFPGSELHLQEPDIDGDMCAVVISTTPLSRAEVQRAWQIHFLEDGGDILEL